MSESTQSEGALATRVNKKKLRCHFCNKIGHFKRDCAEFAKVKDQSKPVQTQKKTKVGAFKLTITADNADNENSSDSESTGVVVQHVLSACFNGHDQWILDSGATCHMCNNTASFDDLQPLPKSLNVTLGDGRNVQAVGQGSVVFNEFVAGQGKLYATQCVFFSYLI